MNDRNEGERADRIPPPDEHPRRVTIADGRDGARAERGWRAAVLAMITALGGLLLADLVGDSDDAVVLVAVLGAALGTWLHSLAQRFPLKERTLSAIAGVLALLAWPRSRTWMSSTPALPRRAVRRRPHGCDPRKAVVTTVSARSQLSRSAPPPSPKTNQGASEAPRKRSLPSSSAARSNTSAHAQHPGPRLSGPPRTRPTRLLPRVRPQEGGACTPSATPTMGCPLRSA